MVEMNPIMIDGNRFISVKIVLPRLTTHLIYCTKGILFDECWNLDEIKRRCDTVVCIGRGKKIEELLSNKIKGCSQAAKDIGISEETKGYNALLRMINET